MFDSEIFDKNRAVPHCSCIYKLNQFSGKYHGDILEKDYQKNLNGCVVFIGTGCFIEKSDLVLSFKGKPKKKSKIRLKNIIYIQ